MKANAVSGVYVIRNDRNTQVYVGSGQDMDDRWLWHQRKLRLGKHENRLLQAAWIELAEAAFTFKQILVVKNLDHLSIHEQLWLDRLGAWHGEGGYNLQAKATAVRGYTYIRGFVALPVGFPAGPYHA